MAQEPAAPVDRTNIDQLRFEHDRLREDFDRLVSCLGDTVCRSSGQFHREKFRAACRRDPPGPNGPSLQDALTIKTVRFVQQLCGGREDMLALKKVSTSFKALADNILMDFGIYVCGGLGAYGENPLRTADCFHSHDQVWEALPLPLWTPAGSAGAILHGYFYVCGGYGEIGRAVQRLDLASRKWEQLGPMNQRRAASAAVIVGGQMYVCGGEDSLEDQVHDSIEVFDALAPNPRNTRRAGVWRTLSTTMSARRRHFGAAAVAGAGRQDLFVCGGRDTPTSRNAEGAVPLASAEALELLEQGPRLRRLPPMPGPRVGHVVAGLRGRVYACGGEAGVALSSVDCYDPPTAAWATCPPMPLARANAAAAVAAGRLLVLGGYRSTHPGAPAERAVQRFDAAAGAWEILDWELVHGRQDFCAAAVWRGALAA